VGPPRTQSIAQRKITQSPLGAGVDDRTHRDPTDPSLQGHQAAGQTHGVDFHRVGTQRGLDSPGDGHSIALEIDEKTLLRETRCAQNSVCAGHHRCPHDGQRRALDRQIAGLQPVDRHEGHSGTAGDAVKDD